MPSAQRDGAAPRAAAMVIALPSNSCRPPA